MSSRRHEIRPEDLAGFRYAQYVRESTEYQREGFGPDAQRAHNRNFALRYGLVDSGHEYAEFVSGGHLKKRTAILKAVTDLQAGHYRVLLVGWTHRFVRSTEDAAALKREIAAAGGVLVYSSMSMVSGQRSSRLGEKMLHVLDEEEREKIADLVADGLYMKFERGGANGIPPLGAKHLYVLHDGSLSPYRDAHCHAVRALDENRLPVLHAVLSRYVDEGSYRRTADWLNAQGHHTNRGRPFTMASVKELVCNPYYGPDEVVRYHPGQADEQRRATPKGQQIFPDDIHDLWTRAQTKREAKSLGSTPQTYRAYPLHGVLRCAACGSIYHGQPDGENRYTLHVRRDTDCPRPLRVPSKLLEDHLAELLSLCPIPRDWRSQIRRLLKEPATDAHEAERKQVEAAITRVRNQHTWGTLTDDEFQRAFRELRARLDALPAPIPTAIDAYREPVDLLRDIGRILGRSEIRRRPDAMRLYRRFCETAFARIEVRGADIVSIQPQPRYAELFAVSLASGETRTSAVERSSAFTSSGIGVETSRTPIYFIGISSALTALAVA